MGDSLISAPLPAVDLGVTPYAVIALATLTTCTMMQGGGALAMSIRSRYNGRLGRRVLFPGWARY